jgi:hypothetical protein
MFSQMIGLFAKPYITNEFDFGEKAFFDELFGFGEKVSKMPEFKQARGVKHFIYVNRTNFGLIQYPARVKSKGKNRYLQAACRGSRITTYAPTCETKKNRCNR